MILYVDGDAFPNKLKPIVLRAIERFDLKTIVVSNNRVGLGDSGLIEYVIVPSVADEADDYIVNQVEAGDLVLTSDIPLADRVISKKAFAISCRGDFWTAENIKPLLFGRNLMQEIRDTGGQTRGPDPLSARDVHQFANQLNAFLSKP